MKNLFFFVLILVSCSSPHSTLDQALIEQMKLEKFSYIEPCNAPMGIADTLLIGYTPRNENGIFHRKDFHPRSLKISGLKFEKTEFNDYHKTVMLFKFEFTDQQEELAFENHQSFIIHFQTHTKNKAEFFKKEGIWILRFKPMI
jgi:hypothetical protein